MRLHLAGKRQSTQGRNPTPDYTQRSTKLRLFLCVAGIILALAFLERSFDRQSWQWVGMTRQSGSRQVSSDHSNSKLDQVPEYRSFDNQPPNDSATDADAASVLERFGIGPHELEQFVNEQPLSPREEDLLIKILYLFPR